MWDPRSNYGEILCRCLDSTRLPTLFWFDMYLAGVHKTARSRDFTLNWGVTTRRGGGGNELNHRIYMVMVLDSQKIIII